MLRRGPWLLLVTLGAFACRDRARVSSGARPDADPDAHADAGVAAAPAATSSPPSFDAAAPPPVEVKTVDVPGDLPVFYLPSAKPKRLVFLHGVCGHGLGYLQSFEHAAAARGASIALQGDALCGGGPFRRWTWDVASVDARIAAAWHAVGDDRPLEDILLVGYSQGASFAEALAARWPSRYTRLILIASPHTPAVRHARALVTMAGSLDMSVASMKRAAADAQRAGVPATFVLIPGARHGEMGDAEPLMTQAIAFVDAH